MNLKQHQYEFFGNATRVGLFFILWIISGSTSKLIPSLLRVGVPVADVHLATDLVEMGVLILMVSYGLQILPRLLAQLFPARSS